MSSHCISSEALTAQLYCPWSCLQGSSQRWLVGVEGLLAGNSHFTLDVIQNLILIATDILSLAMKLLGAHVCVCACKNGPDAGVSVYSSLGVLFLFLLARQKEQQHEL